MKYVEKEQGEVFDWNHFLSPEMNGKRTNGDWRGAVDLATSWVTCACGNQCDIIPRQTWGEPLDEKLANLGYRFNWAVKDRDLRKCRSILKQIEKRSAKLIEEINKK